ncbi:MAG: hypothetical protein ACR2RF_15975 [Geminicoccaceae bacterium]
MTALHFSAFRHEAGIEGAKQAKDYEAAKPHFPEQLNDRNGAESPR